MRVSTAVVFVLDFKPKIHIQILQTDLHTFFLRIVERIWFKIKDQKLDQSILPLVVNYK